MSRIFELPDEQATALWNLIHNGGAPPPGLIDAIKVALTNSTAGKAPPPVPATPWSSGSALITPPTVPTPTGHALGPPTSPKPGPGYAWMGSQSAGGWVEGWVFVGAPAGSTDLSVETPMQYAQRMGVPIGAWITSKKDVDDYLAAKGAAPATPTAPPAPAAPVATFTREQINFATLFAATRGQIAGWNASDPMDGHDPVAINALMGGYLPNLQEAQIRVARGESLDQLKAWISGEA